VLREFAGSLREADERLAGRLGREDLAAIVAAIPEAWLPDEPAIGDAAAQRDAYVEYLVTRLAPPRLFVEEADRVPA
jgi:hypothetical protein